MESCAICCDGESYLDWQTLPCGHSFHGICLSAWLWKNQTCPICRSSKNDYEKNEDDEFDTEVLDIIHQDLEIRTKRQANVQKVIKRSKKAPSNSAIVKQVSTYDKWKLELKVAQKELRMQNSKYSELQKEFSIAQQRFKQQIQQICRDQETSFFRETQHTREQILLLNKRVTRAYRNKKLSEHRLSTIGDTL